MIVARRCFVSGRVQGVFFRASTRQKAIELGCAGYARNLPDGRVEVLALAEPHALDQLIDWLWKGPPAARVSNVEVIEVPVDQIQELPVGFGTG
jgi:acylphosphatase